MVRGIYKAINLLPTNRALADRWVRAANSDPLFSGRCAMALIASGKLDELYPVRRYLDAEVYRCSPNVGGGSEMHIADSI